MWDVALSCLSEQLVEWPLTLQTFNLLMTPFSILQVGPQLGNGSDEGAFQLSSNW